MRMLGQKIENKYKKKKQKKASSVPWPYLLIFGFEISYLLSSTTTYQRDKMGRVLEKIFYLRLHFAKN